MTGPEHYQAAEDNMYAADEAPAGSKDEWYAIAAAQVHATLAQAAAIIDIYRGQVTAEWVESVS
jgi:hypothetical protein